jgi:plasmid stabilization system protein ParE
MTFRVTWDPEAENELQRIYDTAIDKEGVANAATRIGLELAAVPLEAGESRDKKTRVLFKFPLIVWYRIDERMREVVVVRVTSFRRTT